MATTARQRILQLIEARGILTARRFARAGVHTQELTRLVADGTLQRFGRGKYRLAGAEVTEHHGLALAAAAAPGGVICLLSALAFHEGIEVHEIERQPVRVTSVSKTIADLFKARHRVGLDVAVEALREAWRDRRFTMPDLERAARACRVERVMRPYLEGIVG